MGGGGVLNNKWWQIGSKAQYGSPRGHRRPPVAGHWPASRRWGGGGASAAGPFFSKHVGKASNCRLECTLALKTGLTALGRAGSRRGHAWRRWRKMTASPSACRQNAFPPCSGGMRAAERVSCGRSNGRRRTGRPHTIGTTPTPAPSGFFYAGVAGKGRPLAYVSERDCAVGELLLLACGDGQCA